MAKDNKILLRHKAIKKLISDYEIGDQHKLVEMLNEKHKIATTQSIVSRDLRQLSISKRKVKNKMLYELPKINIEQEILRLAISDIVHNESMIIVKTMPGIAAFVGDYIDLQDNLNVIGSLSGENVVFIVPESAKKIKEIFENVCSALYFKK